MSKKVTIQGQSLVFNALFILVNLAGLTLVTMGFHDAFENSKWFYVGIGGALMLVSIIGLIIFKGRLFMSLISRYLVGGLFIVSGLIKANDPLGFSYKLEEYFEDGALAFRIKEWFGAPGFSLEFFIEWALVLSVLICVAEIVLGVLVLLGGKIRLVSWLMILMMVFFTFLTWHTANCDADKKFRDRDTYAMNDPLAEIKIKEAKENPDITIVSKTSTELVVDEMKQPQCVSDCGCFGDAMKGSVGRSLTPKESLWKDIVLVYLVIWIFVARFKIQPNTREENIYMLAVSAVIISFFSYIFGWYFPILFGLVALLVSLWILRAGGRFLGNYLGASLLVSAMCFGLTSYVLLFEPIKDYRPYAVGSNLKEKMNDGIEGKYMNLLVYKNLKTGEKKEFDANSPEYMDSKIWEQTEVWAYDTMWTKEIIPTRLPSITTQFNPMIPIADVGEAERELSVVSEQMKIAEVPGIEVWDKSSQTSYQIPESEFNEADYDTASYEIRGKVSMLNPELSEISLREYFLQAETIFAVFSKDLKQANFDKIEAYKAIYKEAKAHGIPMFMICSSSRDEVNAWRAKNDFQLPVFINDETELKAIARSNPSLMVVRKGVVKGKYPFRSLPTYQWLDKHILK
ncbi:MAG: DoxX family membrane protein [Bacteroidetes bacterium]|nr:MAG: DoxX family membrane protein [Bacteroidota bacterium]